MNIVMLMVFLASYPLFGPSVSVITGTKERKIPESIPKPSKIFILLPGVMRKETVSNDSLMLRDMVSKLNGIECYFVFDGDQKKMAMNLRALLEFKQLGIPPFLQDYQPEYRITLLDADGRLITLECLSCETTKTMSYWDTEDGGTLIAWVSKGCGPICSYQIEFYKYKDGAKTKSDRDRLITNAELSDFLEIPEDATEMMAKTAFELPVQLRKDGHDISISVWLEDENFKDKLKGDLIPFTWNGMNFYQGEIINSKQR